MKEILNMLENITQILTTEKKRLLNSTLMSFTQTAYDLKKYPTYAALSFFLLLLPGSNFYLNLSITPQNPIIRKPNIQLSSPSKYPIRKANTPTPYISAKSAVVIDSSSAAILYSKNPDEQLLPASTTKIMTALVVLNNYQLTDVITVRGANHAIGQTIDLVPGERLSVENALYGLMLESGNDVAFTLAENYKAGYDGFVDEMNRLAQEFHLKNTKFRNVSGIEQYGHFTTVKDLARLATIAMQNETLAAIVSTKEKTITDIDGTIQHKLTNINKLLGVVEGIRGVKTGWTEHAGECLVTDTIRDGNEVIVVVLGSQDRFGDSKTLIEWAYQAYSWETPKRN